MGIVWMGIFICLFFVNEVVKDFFDNFIKGFVF